MSKELYEAGLVAIADTAKKAFIEGFLMAANPDYATDLNDPESAWLSSEVYAAVVKSVEQHIGRKL